MNGQTGLLSDQPSRDLTRRATGTLAILKMMQIASHLSPGVKARTVPVDRKRRYATDRNGSRDVGVLRAGSVAQHSGGRRTTRGLNAPPGGETARPARGARRTVLRYHLPVIDKHAYWLRATSRHALQRLKSGVGILLARLADEGCGAAAS